jgi:hypothetical protein
MPHTIYFNHRYHHTMKEEAVYAAEINEHKEVLFYVCETDNEPFYRDRVTDIVNKPFLAMYLSVLLKSIMEQQR